MDDYQAIVACLGAILGIYAVRWYTNPLRAIPTVGGSDLPGLSYLGAVRMQGDCRKVLQEGYRKYLGSAFKIALPDRWLIVVQGRDMVEEFRKRGDGELSSPVGAREALQQDNLMEPPLILDKYHVDVVRERFTRRLPVIIPELVDEVAVVLKEHIVSSGNEWTSVEIMPAMQKIVTRTSNRAFVGLPLCRNEGYIALAIGFAVDLMKNSLLLRLFPRFLGPLVAFFANFVKRDTHRAMVHLGPVIEQRQKTMAELGDGWNDKPNDVLQFLLDNAATKNVSEPPFVVAQRLLELNFATIHTSSMTITHALYRLAAKPAELVAPLRDEIETALAANGGGWTAAALRDMWMLDSLLRECLRFHGIGLLAMGRIAMADVTLSDGTRVPRGAMVCAAAYAMHHDDALLAGARAFDAFRFARMRRAAGQSQSLKQQLTSTSAAYIPFGHGSHACPGRYFASNMLKAILAHIVLNYDLQLGGDGGSGSRPPDAYFALGVMPALRGRVLFKKRERPA